MNDVVRRLGFWSTTIAASIVLLIDAGLILSTIFLPMNVTTREW
jgi:hypothetical protein